MPNSTLGANSGGDVTLEGKVIFQQLPVLEMPSQMPLSPGETYSLQTGSNSLSVGPIEIPLGTEVIVPLNANWVII